MLVTTGRWMVEALGAGIDADIELPGADAGHRSVMRVWSAWTGAPHVTVAVGSDVPSGNASVFVDSRSLLYIGAGAVVHCIDLTTRERSSSIELGSPVRHFVADAGDEPVLVALELGFASLLAGRLRWSWDGGDVVETFEVDADRIRVTQMEGRVVHLSRETGAVLAP